MFMFCVKVFFAYIIGSSIAWIYRKYQLFQTFTRKGIKGPKPNLLVGNYWDLRQPPDNKLPHEVMNDWIDQYGNILGYYSPNRCHLVINDVHILKKISVHKAFQDREPLVLDVDPLRHSLFAIGGESWRRSRKTISPLLSRFKVNSPPISDVVDDCVNNYISHLRPEEVPTDEPFTINIVENVHRFTFDVICRTSLGMKTDCYSENDQLVQAVVDFFENAFNNAVLLGEMFPFFASILTFINNYLTAGKMTDTIVGHLKHQVKQFLDSKGKDNQQNEKVVFLKAMLTFLAEEKLTQQEFTGNIYLIVLAGFEATANALIFCLYLIAKHQHIQDKIRSDLHLEPSNERSYIDMVWLESLRYYPPPISVVNRQASQTVNIEGLTIEKGWVVEAPVWQIHHSDVYWTDPWLFDPERFSPDNSKSIEPAAFLPYGFGGRTCLGMNLANLEARKFLTTILSKYRITFSEKTMDPIKFKVPTSILNPDGPVYLKFEPL
ncbi:cytochrome P450 3A18-like [Tetranychus urticae]|uniref:Cytochrome P450 n=1 Tax=Tetranychus urticae TaxID=32264 RepID=T1JYU1_TETUR|nr:cytochrome P450 3A18-like [Tetranychus urticae]